MPTVPLGRLDVVIVGAVPDRLTVCTYAFVSEPNAFVARTVYVYVPAALYVPVITPADDIERPVGNVPAITEKTSGAVPMAASVTDALLPTTADAMDDVTIDGAAPSLTCAAHLTGGDATHSTRETMYQPQECKFVFASVQPAAICALSAPLIAVELKPRKL